MEDTLLYRAAVEFGKLANIGYRIVLGRKKQSYILDIRFPAESFFHLIGLQHLEDLIFPSQNKERIYKEILEGNVTQEFIEKSQYYEKWDIEDRIKLSMHLEEMLDNLPEYFRINMKIYKTYTSINADFLALLHDPLNTLSQIYYFLIHSYTVELPLRFTSCSLFRKRERDYTYGTSKTTLLLVEKVEDVENNTVVELFRNPNYKEESE